MIVERLRQKFIRAELDNSEHTVGKKIRNAVTAKLPNVLVVGEREQLAETVTLRRYGRKEQESISIVEAEAGLLQAIALRKDE